MKKILFGTRNKTRLEYLQGILQGLPINLVSLRELNIESSIEEDGNSPIENSKKKALGYYDLAQIPTFSIDAGLYIDEFPEYKQPGAFVKRINKNRKEATDEEMLEYYIAELKKYGGRSKGRWKNALTFVLSNNKIYTTIFERETIFTSEKCKAWATSEPLNSIQLDLATGKYIAELTVEEKKESQKDLVNHIYEFMKNTLSMLRKVFSINFYKINLLHRISLTRGQTSYNTVLSISYLAN
ncbi:MAG: hypothetical protein FH753_15485 [Firmicutes bacterium]|nr:hypothetical protein [Bacillota bacterium]